MGFTAHPVASARVGLVASMRTWRVACRDVRELCVRVCEKRVAHTVTRFSFNVPTDY